MDLLRWPVIGTIARRRHGRLILQLPLLAIAALVVVHGLIGPQLAPRNLATVSVWIHYRGLLVIALLAIGNLFCTGCPIILVRDTGRRFFHPALRWPRVLRHKWPAIALLVAVLFSYELFDLWDLPRATAWLIVAYFAAALLIDTIFAGASFCKYVCPVGQFNFMTSTMSPFELRVKETTTCRGCRTADCIKGRAADTPPVRRGCELGLFMPMKVGNLDCTLCFDCIRACPHDNIALLARVPGDELANTRRRSGIGRLAVRRDLAVLAVVFTFGALLNAFAMTRPAVAIEARVAAAMHVSSELPVLAVIFVAGLIVVPALLIAATAWVTPTTPAEGGTAPARRPSIAAVGVRYSYSFVPFGVGAWTAHYAFHLLTGILTIVPVTQSALIDFAGWPVLGEPLWRWAGLRPGAVFPVQLGFLLLGAAGSVGIAGRIAEHQNPRRAFLSSLPWSLLIMALTAAAIWILAQPMDMRGIGFGG